MVSLRKKTASKVLKYGVVSGPYFPVFSPNTGKYGREITPYLGTFDAVEVTKRVGGLSRLNAGNKLIVINLVLK